MAENERRPRREYRAGARGARASAQGWGGWRRDGRDCEYQCAPGPVPLVTRLAWSLGVPASLISIRARRCAPRVGQRARGGGWKCSGGRSCFDRSLNPTATSVLPARLSVTSASRTHPFRVAMREGVSRVAPANGRCNDAIGIDGGAAAVRSGRNAKEGAREIGSECWAPRFERIRLLDQMIAVLDSIGHFGRR